MGVNVGVNGPVLIGPVAVATKKLTFDPGVKPLPWIENMEPARITLGTALINGVPGAGVGVAVGARVGVGVGVGRGEGVGVGVGGCIGWLNSSTRSSSVSAA